MKLLLINNGYPTARRPAYVNYMETIKRCLEKAGLDVDLLVLDSDAENLPGKAINYLKFYFRLLTAPLDKYDWIYIHHWPFCVLPLVFRKKSLRRVVIHWHGADVYPHKWFGMSLNRFSYRVIQPHFRHIAPSGYFATMVSKTTGIPVQEIFVSPSGGIDVHRFAPPVNPKPVGTEIHIGFAASLKKDKGVDLLLRLLADAERFRQQTGKGFILHYILYGREVDFYHQQLKRYQNTVAHKPYPKGRMHEFYHNIDVLAYPTLNDSLGLVGIEAMSCGIPVVGTDDFALKEYIIPGITGERFRKNDYEDFFTSLVRCVNRLGHYQPRGYIVENYSEEAVIEGYRSFFKPE